LISPLAIFSSLIFSRRLLHLALFAAARASGVVWIRFLGMLGVSLIAAKTSK
jgi:hypothetical protein